MDSNTIYDDSLTFPVHFHVTQVEFITLPLKLLGKIPETIPPEPSRAYENLKKRPKDTSPVWDYVANLLGFQSWVNAKADGIHIVCFNTKQPRAYLLIILVRSITHSFYRHLFIYEHLFKKSDCFSNEKCHI